MWFVTVIEKTAILLQHLFCKSLSFGPFSCNIPDSQKDIFERKPPQNLDFK